MPCTPGRRCTEVHGDQPAADHPTRPRTIMPMETDMNPPDPRLAGQASALTPLQALLVGYARYHRDVRNIATHTLGVPLIVLAVAVLLARPALVDLGAFSLRPADLAVLATLAWALRLDRGYGAVLAAFLGLALLLAHGLAQAPVGVWLACGPGLFVAGWVIQFIGHAWEGRKPAFLDDLRGLLVGPLFVIAEIGFDLDLRRELQALITREAGPVRHARATHA
jgi:uncharacterized membrane protein YGL010W